MSEPDVSNLLTVARAIEIIDTVPVSPRIMRARLIDALGRHLAQEIVADRDSPPFDKSLMDGFALRSADATADRFTLRNLGEIAAGSVFDRSIGAGECVAIYTGAPMPDGADSVVPVELVDSRAADAVTLRGPVRAGQNIAPRGADCRQGQVLLRRGSLITAAGIAVAASVGASELDVFAPPRVALLSSGDELVPIEQTPRPEQIRNSNSPMLAALLRTLGCEVIDRGWVRDDPELIRSAIESSLRDAEVLFITGGMSMGEYDFVPRVLNELGVDLQITKLKIKPGKPFVFGVLHQTSTPRFIFGLPGNPVSGFVCAVRLAARLLARLSGGQASHVERWLHGELTAALPANGAREFYQPATLNRDGTITPLTWKGSADVYTLAGANVLLVRAENEPPQPVGHRVRVLRLPDSMC